MNHREVGAPLVPIREALHEMIARSRDRSPVAFDPAASPWHERAVFVVGAPRSGTTWLHQLLAVHPDVATAGEAHVVCEGVASLFANHEDPDPYMMLSTWLSRGELLALARQLVDGIFSAARDAVRPGATHVLDKTPNHEPHAALLGELFPDAAYVHIVRDGRDMAASAADLWSGFGGAYRSIGASAAVWAAAVTDVRRHLAGLRYHEVRYEDLVADPVGGLTAILEHIGLRHDPEYVAAAVEFGRAPINMRPSDARVGARKWTSLSRDDERAVAVAAGPLLVELGYLQPSELEALLAHRSPAIVRAELAAGARRLAGGAARRGRATVEARRRRRRIADVDRVRRLGQAMADALVAGDDVTALLAEDVTIEIGGAARQGRAAVADELASRASGARTGDIAADADAAAVQFIDPGGRRTMHRYFVHGDRVGRVVVQ